MDCSTTHESTNSSDPQQANITRTTESGLPRIAFQWILQNNVTSDTDLAILSNVCIQWRTWLVLTLTEQAVKQVVHNQQLETETTLSKSRSLLLPSMMRGFFTQPHTQRLDPTATTLHSTSHAATDNNEHFCIAWFASEGIQQVPWSQMLREDEALEKMIFKAHDSSASRDLTQNVLETNHSESEDERKPSAAMDISSSAAATSQKLQQQEAIISNNATASTTQSTIEWKRKGGTSLILSNEWRGYRKPLQVLRPFGYTPAFVEFAFSGLRKHQAGTIDEDVEDEDTYSRATFAVRGVTVARPESYCLCMDRIRESSSVGSYQSRLRQLRDRKELRRTVFPRVLDRKERPPVVQFLNVDKSSAVTLMTPALACGTLKEPFTIFVVGIATEDGCFLSGLRHRFEIGHLYPKDQLADITDSSAICIFTENWSPGDDNNGHGGEGMGNDDDVDEWDMDEDMLESKDGMPRCTCVFEGVTDKLAVLEDEDERQGRLVRGQLGPGAWHCYTIVVDGAYSLIRIDGLEEPAEVHQQFEVPAFLDGLTLGSDHCFGTSLCCGQGSPGEGEGALAEVAVFGGRMNTTDLITLERHFMHKHGIPPQVATAWADDELSRQARAMFQLVGNPRGNRVPLRYFTKSPNVAWQLYHPVSQQFTKRERIGARNDESSSEW